jgi:hypothetical protein
VTDHVCHLDPNRIDRAVESDTCHYCHRFHDDAASPIVFAAANVHPISYFQGILVLVLGKGLGLSIHGLKFEVIRERASSHGMIVAPITNLLVLRPVPTVRKSAEKSAENRQNSLKMFSQMSQ